MFSADEDIKIYLGDDESAAPVSEGERSAEEFMQHKKNGNLDKTKQLGELLASTLLGDAPRFRDEPYGSQKLVLISFLALDALEEIPNQMLQKSAQAVFRSTVERRNPEIHRVIVDSTAYTMYILNDREHPEEGWGRTLAELCQADDDQELIASGNQLSAEYRKLFRDMIRSYHFV